MLKTGAVQRCVAEILAKAKEFREAFGAEPQARSLKWAALQVERALRDESDQLLTLAQAAELSGARDTAVAELEVPEGFGEGRVDDRVWDDYVSHEPGP